MFAVGVVVAFDLVEEFGTSIVCGLEAAILQQDRKYHVDHFYNAPDLAEAWQRGKGKAPWPSLLISQEPGEEERSFIQSPPRIRMQEQGGAAAFLRFI